MDPFSFVPFSAPAIAVAVLRSIRQTPRFRERGSAPKGGRHSTTCFDPQWKLCLSSAHLCSGSLITVYCLTPYSLRYAESRSIILRYALMCYCWTNGYINIAILCHVIVIQSHRSVKQTLLNQTCNVISMIVITILSVCLLLYHLYIYIYIYYWLL